MNSSIETDFPVGGDLLIVSRYLTEKTNNPELAKKLAPQLGKEIKRIYVECHGAPARTLEIEINDRPVRVHQYTQADRPIFDQAWDTLMYKKFSSAVKR